MKRNQAISAYSAILGVKLNKMNDGMTDAILADTLALSAVNDQFVKVQEELRKRTIETIDKERLEAYDNLITKMKALDAQKQAAINAVIKDNYADVLKAQNTYVKALNKWLDKDVSLDLELIERGEFIKAMKESEQDITPANLDIISVLFKGEKKAEIKVDDAEIESLLED